MSKLMPYVVAALKGERTRVAALEELVAGLNEELKDVRARLLAFGG